MAKLLCNASQINPFLFEFSPYKTSQVDLLSRKVHGEAIDKMGKIFFSNN